MTDAVIDGDLFGVCGCWDCGESLWYLMRRHADRNEAPRFAVACGNCGTVAYLPGGPEGTIRDADGNVIG